MKTTSLMVLCVCCFCRLRNGTGGSECPTVVLSIPGRDCKLL